MAVWVFLLVVPPAAAQTDDLRLLVDKLRSESVEERTEAERALKARGKEAAPALEKAARDPDPEVAERAHFLLRRVEALDLLPPSLRASADRLAEGGGAAWAELFCEVSEGKARELEVRDLERLATRALAGQGPTPLRLKLLGHIGELGLRSLAPQIRPLLKNPDPQLRLGAVVLLGRLKDRPATLDLLPLLGDPDPDIRGLTARTLVGLRPLDVLPAAMRLLDASDPGVRKEGIQFLSALRYAPAVPRFRSLLRDPEGPVRAAAVLALAALAGRDASADLKEFLKDDSPEVREGVTERLVQLEGIEAVPLLLPLRKDRNLRVRMTALKVLAEFERPEVVPEFLELLHHEDADTWRTAMNQLRVLRAVEAVPGLLQLLRSSEGIVRGEVLEALEALAPREARTAARSLLGHSDPRVRRQALGVLGGSRLDDAELAGLLQDAHSDVRSSLAEATRTLDEPQARNVLRTLLGDANPNVRYTAVRESLGRFKEAAVADVLPALKGVNPYGQSHFAHEMLQFGDRRSVSALLELLDAQGDEVAEHVRSNAADVLKRAHVPEAVPVLKRILGNPRHPFHSGALPVLASLSPTDAIAASLTLNLRSSYLLRVAAAETLGSLRMRAGIPWLRTALKDQSGEVRHAALRAVTALHAREAIPEVTALLKPSDHTVYRVIEALADLEATESIPALWKFVDGEADYGTVIALATLLDFGEAGARERLVGLLRHAEPELRWSALKAIANIDGPAAAPLLLPLTQDDNTDVRKTALEMLAKTGPPDAVPPLLEALGDINPEIRSLAADGLGRIRARDAAAPLLRLLSDFDESVVSSAVGALVRIGVGEHGPEIARRLEEQGGRVVRAAGRMILPELAPYAQGLLKHHQYYRRRNGIQMLREIGARGALTDVRALLADPDEEVRAAAVGFLIRLGTNEDRPRIEKALEDPDSEVRLVALGAVTRSNPERLPSFLKDRQRAIRIAAAFHLVGAGRRDQAPEIVRLMTSPHPYERGMAIQALGRLRAWDQEPEVEKRLTDPSDYVRAEAAGWMCRRGSRKGVPVILRMEERACLLNSVRKPGAWKTLEEATVKGVVEGPGGEVLSRRLKELGFTLEMPKPTARGGPPFPWTPVRLEELQGRESILDAIQSNLNDGWTVVLEDDRVRIVPTPQAWRFWHAWWAAEPK